MNNANIDIAVLLLFFNRPQTFKKVFEEVKKARPSKLFLYQDGARGEQDMKGIMACREIASDENIDWECEVCRNYQTKNYGCDPSGYMAHTWAFSLADKCIVLEDDVVPSQSFFPFCKEMLDKYENDERITMITGYNPEEITQSCPYDYLFTSVFDIWGWASWRRVVSKWDAEYSFLNDDYNMKQLTALARQRGYRKDLIKMCHDHSTSGKQYFESIFWTNMLFNSGLAIMPTHNQINNVGLTAGAHYSADLETMPKRLRKTFTMKRFELKFPLRHPKYIIEDVAYKERYYKIMAWNNPFTKMSYSLEELWLNIKAGNMKKIATATINNIKRHLGLTKHK